MNVKKSICHLNCCRLCLFIDVQNWTILLRSNSRSSSAAIIIAYILYVENDERDNKSHDMHNTIVQYNVKILISIQYSKITLF